jgi:hypothetical protein
MCYALAGVQCPRGAELFRVVIMIVKTKLRQITIWGQAGFIGKELDKSLSMMKRSLSK